MEFDVVIVGAGPAGLATAIRLKQDRGREGRRDSGRRRREGLGGRRAHPVRCGRSIRSASTGCCRNGGRTPIGRSPREVQEDQFLYLGPAGGGLRLPNIFMPKLMNNHGNFVGSLGNVTRYLGRKAEAARGRDLSRLSGGRSARRGRQRSSASRPATWESAATASRTTDFTRGMELRAKYTIFAEGARGSLTKQLVAASASTTAATIQKYGLGVKELWQVEPDEARAGPGPAFDGLAAVERYRRRLVALPFRRQSGVGRFRRASQLQEPDPVAVRRIAALQDPSDDPRRLRGRQAHRLRRPRHRRGRLAIGAEAGLPGRLPRRRFAPAS